MKCLNGPQLLLSLIVACYAFNVLADENIRVIAVAGKPAPDGNGVYYGFSMPLLNESGVIVFEGELKESLHGYEEDRAIFQSDRMGEVVQIVRENQPAPNGNGKFSHLLSFVLSDSGQVAFISVCRDTLNGRGDQSGIYLSDGRGVLTTLVRGGESTPDGKREYLSFFCPSINRHGQLAFIASLADDKPTQINDRGLFLYDGRSGIESIASAGDPAPGGDASHDKYITATSLNDRGQIAFSNKLLGTGRKDDRSGVFRFDPGVGVVQIVRAGMEAPGDDAKIVSVDTGPCVDAEGQVGFGFNNGRGILLSDVGGRLELIAHTGQPIYDGTGHKLVEVEGPVIGESGDVMYSTTSRKRGQRDAITTSFVIDRDSNLIQIAQSGDSAPSHGLFHTVGLGSVNRAGQIAFKAKLGDQPDNDYTGTGIYFYKPGHSLLTVARSGDDILGSKIDEVGFKGSGGINKDQSGFNNEGQVAFSFRLEDGREGVAVWSPPKGKRGEGD